MLDPEPTSESPAVEPDTTPAATIEGTADEPKTFSEEYVKELRDESAAHRIKAKKVDAANARLVASYASQDGRLVDVTAVGYSDALLDSDGVVDREKVTEAIGALLADKPYMQARRPVAPIAQGVREDVPAEVSLFGLMRGY